MLKAERYLWAHPQTGFKEWDAHNYLKEKFVEMGFCLKEAGNIPGFYFDIDSGVAGPTVCLLGELDSIICFLEGKDNPVFKTPRGTDVVLFLNLRYNLKTTKF